MIASPHNPRVAAARKLLSPRARAAAGLFVVEGPHAVEAALASAHHDVVDLFVTKVAADRDVSLLRTAAHQDVPVTVVSDRVAAALSDTVTPQGVVAVVRAPRGSLTDVLAAGPSLLVVLHEVADPGNAGTVIRTADAAGADAVVVAGDSVDPYNPKCIRASAGSLFHLPVVRAPAGGDLGDRLRAAGLRVAATDAAADGDLFALAADGLLAAPLAWVFGNEAHGLAPVTLENADLRVRIPIHGRAESLNLASAVAVCLYLTAFNRRDLPDRA